MNPNSHILIDPDRPRRFDGMWVDREVADLDDLAATGTDTLNKAVSDRGRCLWEILIGDPPDPIPVRHTDESAETVSIDRAMAEWLCTGCPVRRQCLELELRTHGGDTVGVCGGLAETDRRELPALWAAHPARGAFTREPHSGDDWDAHKQRARRTLAAERQAPTGEQARRIRSHFGGGLPKDWEARPAPARREA